MDDTISRQTAIDVLHGYFDGALETDTICPKDIYNLFEIIPSVQPEIIRCKDCKWYGRLDKRRFYRGMDCLQDRIDTIVPDKDFCSRAERRTDD